MQIVSHRELVTEESYALSYEWNDEPGSGFSFDCDEKGNLIQPMNPAAEENWVKCTTGVYDVRPLGIVTYRWSWVQPAIGKCSCGCEVSLDGFTNTCVCGRDYNSSGDLLAPRSQWGEDTGESLADILRIK